MAEQTLVNEPVSALIEYSDYKPIILTKRSLSRIVELLFYKPPLELESSKVAQKLAEDKRTIRQKYLLPAESMLIQNPGEYYHELELIVRQEGIVHRNKTEFSRFFQQRLASAVFLGSHDNVIVHAQLQDADSVSVAEEKARNFQHELIHAQQSRKFPRMPLLLREYEAVLAGANDKIISSEPWLIFERIAMTLTKSQLEAMWRDYSIEKRRVQRRRS